MQLLESTAVFRDQVGRTEMLFCGTTYGSLNFSAWLMLVMMTCARQ